MISCTFVLLLLCSILPAVQGCDWLERYGHVNNHSLTLLRLMGGETTIDEPPVPFPYRLYSNVGHAEVQTQLAFVRDSLELILGLYRHDNISSASWDTQITDHFLTTVYRQVHELSRCVSANHYVDRRLRRYYGKLKRRTLCSTGGSAASWELIRVETYLHLHQLELLVNHMTEGRTPSRGHSANRPQPGERLRASHCTTTPH